MVNKDNRSSKGKNCEVLHSKRIRGSLMLLNHSLTSWAKKEGVSAALVSRLIHGGRPGKRGRSKTIRQKLMQLQRAE